MEEFLRVSALLHDVGHGPFCHFFDHNFLDAYGLTHEDLSQRIILEKLAPVIRRLRRSPRGRFRPGERLDPRHIAFLIKKGGGRPSAAVPRWVALLKPILDGIYTADNLDYVLRDSYMCGVAIGPVDLERLLHYTFFTPNGLTLHRAGTSALTMFLTARLYLYTNVYYHRTTRAIDLHLKELFKPTMRILFPHHPRELNRYLQLTDWTLLETVRRWPESRDKARRALGREWERVLLREVKWKLAYEKTLPIREVEPGRTVLNEAEWEQKIRALLPPRLRRIEYQADIAWQDPRPENPLQMGRRQIYVFNPATGTSAKEPLQELFEYMPSKIILCRVYGAGHDHDRELARAAEAALHSRPGAIKTNI
ncbi:MAG: HD domain-containing protein [Deltaproteobacteria bacterium]|nr:HD domain-containing protein [Deltaproteobacteria bacterium]